MKKAAYLICLTLLAQWLFAANLTPGTILKIENEKITIDFGKDRVAVGDNLRVIVSATNASGGPVFHVIARLRVEEVYGDYCIAFFDDYRPYGDLAELKTGMSVERIERQQSQFYTGTVNNYVSIYCLAMNKTYYGVYSWGTFFTPEWGASIGLGVRDELQYSISAGLLFRPKIWDTYFLAIQLNTGIASYETNITLAGRVARNNYFVMPGISVYYEQFGLTGQIGFSSVMPYLIWSAGLNYWF